MRSTIPDILIEQAALGELSQEELEALKKECDLEARIAELKASNEEILNRYAPEDLAERIRTRLNREKPAEETKEASAREKKNNPGIIEGVFRIALPLAAAAALFIAVGLPAMQDRSLPLDDAGAAGVRLKGMQPEMHIYRQSGSEAVPLKDGQTARTNDLLQISYIAADATYGVILSIDGRGTVTLHYPDSKNGDQRLASGGEYALPFSYQLDDAPRFERFYFIAGKQEIPMDLVMEEAHRVAMSRTGKWVEAFKLPDEFRQQSILLLKE